MRRGRRVRGAPSPTRGRRPATGGESNVPHLQEAVLQAASRHGVAPATAEPLVRSHGNPVSLERLLVAVSSAVHADAVMSLLRERPPHVTPRLPAPLTRRVPGPAKARGPARSRRRQSPQEA
jgi:hypothetical protein